MINVLADLALESEAATTVVLRLAGAVDRAAAGDAAEAALRRLGLAVTKYWVCKRWSAHAAEALECLGGNGYVEDSGMPRLYREAPLVSIWEGSGNVAALDTLRAMVRQPETVQAFFAELELATGADPRYDDALALLQKEFSDTDELPYRARRVVERMALVLQGSLLVRHGNTAMADAFLSSRLSNDWGVAFGTLPTGIDTKTILDRAALVA
jgi:putative acyl-CoA dehydrogenase